MTWKLTDITIDTMSGLRTVRAYVSPEADGLAVHPAIENGALWTITHVPSGLGLRCGSVDAENAFGFALQLARLGDWTRGKHAVWGDELLCRSVVGLMERALASGEYTEIDRQCNPDVPPHARYKSRYTDTALDGAA